MHTQQMGFPSVQISFFNRKEAIIYKKVGKYF
jgi:hypothetical protein